jgi:hypothetical protein
MKNTFSVRLKTLASALLAVGLTSGIVTTANANLLINGSFETPDLTSGVHLGVAPPTGWTGSGNNYGILDSSGPSISPYPAAQNGGQYLYTSAAHVTQGFTIATPGAYLLTWFDNTWVTGGNESYAVRVTDSSSQQVAYQAFIINYTVGAWHQRAMDLPGLAAGNYSLSIGYSTTATFFDNVSLDAAAVPEPSTYLAGALMLLPFGATVIRSLRKTRRMQAIRL